MNTIRDVTIFSACNVEKRAYPNHPSLETYFPRFNKYLGEKIMLLISIKIFGV